MDVEYVLSPALHQRQKLLRKSEAIPSKNFKELHLEILEERKPAA
jgi:hypothetical protein